MAELARAYLMSGSHAAARDLIEAILPTADRLGLREVVGELLPSRAWAIAADGRTLEAIALLRGSLVFAEREGLFNAEMRSRMNLSSYATSEYPAECLEVAWTGARRARERGYTGWAISAGGNACDAALSLGEWDKVEAIAAELDVLGEWVERLGLRGGGDRVRKCGAFGVETRRRRSSSAASTHDSQSSRTRSCS